MTRLRKLARGQECQIRIPGICNWEASTTVLCHLTGGGMGAKRNDFTAAAWGCSSCHDAIDGRGGVSALLRHDLSWYHIEGVIRTQEAILRDHREVLLKSIEKGEI